GVLMPDVNKDFVRIAREQGWYSEELMQRIAEEGHIHFDEVPAEVQRVFVTAHDVTPERHIACMPPSRSWWTPRSPRRATSRARRPRSTCARSTSWRTTWAARA